MKKWDTVELLVDLPEYSISKGAVGVIVDEYTAPAHAFEIEFCNQRGETVALAVVEASQLVLCPVPSRPDSGDSLS